MAYKTLREHEMLKESDYVIIHYVKERSENYHNRSKWWVRSHRRKANYIL